MSKQNEISRGQKKKIRGFKGRVRAGLFLLSLTFSIIVEYFIFALIAWSIARMTVDLTKGSIGAISAMFVFFGVFLGLFILFHGLGSYLYVNKGKYHFRLLSDQEWETLSGHNLIHYTDYITGDDYADSQRNGNIQLIGNGSVLSNYSMRKEDRNNKYVWFHLSNKSSSDEPDFDAFWFSHSTEFTPRSYKVVIPFSSLRRDQVMIRPLDSAIALAGDFYGPANVTDTFPWYNDRIYVLRSIRFRFSTLVMIFYIGILQMRGESIDKKQLTA